MAKKAAKKKPVKKSRRHGPKSYDWRPAFLEALAINGNITHSAKSAGVHRNSPVQERKKDPDFNRQVEEALEQASDELEREAWRRAVEGVEVPKTIAKERELVREYSDTLLIFLLKGTKPEKYRERTDNRHVIEEVRVAGGTREERIESVRETVLKLAAGSRN